MNSYENFRIELTDYIPGSKRENIAESLSVRVVESPVGKQGDKSKVKVEFPAQLVNYQRNLEKRLQKRELSEEELIVLGEDLAKLLLPPTVRDYYYRSRAQLKPNEGLRIQIYTDESALGALPWEYVYVWAPVGDSTAKKDTGFLALDREISIVRYLNDADIEVPVGPDQVKIVALLSDGAESGHQQLDMAREEDNLRQALVGVGGAELKVFHKGKLGGLLDWLTENNAKVFHFAGHGTIEKEPLGKAFTFREDRNLVLVGEEGGEQLWDDEKVAMELGDRGIRLVVLSACDSGGLDPKSQFSAGIPALIQQKIPAVVGMQFTVRDANAIAFCHRLYLALASGKSIDTAVSEGRHGIYQRPMDAGRDWGVPVLYLQTNKAVLFPKPIEPMLINWALLFVSLGVLGAWFALHILPLITQAAEQFKFYIGFGMGAIPAIFALFQLIASKALSVLTSGEKSSWSERLLRHRFARGILFLFFCVVLVLTLTTHSIYMSTPPGKDPVAVGLFEVKDGEYVKYSAIPRLFRDENGTVLGGPVFFQRTRPLQLKLETYGWEFDKDNFKENDSIKVPSDKWKATSLVFWRSTNFLLTEKELKLVRLAPKPNLLSYVPDKFKTDPKIVVEVKVTVGNQEKIIPDFKHGVIWVGAPLVGLERFVSHASQTDLFTSLETCLMRKMTEVNVRKTMAKWNSEAYFLELELNDIDTIQVEASLRMRKDSKNSKQIELVSASIPPSEKLYGGPYPTFCLERKKK